MDKSTVMKNYRFLALMLFAMVAGCVAGWFFPEFGHFIKPAGTVFINMMFCVVVPLVFASISNSVASVRSRKRAGIRQKISGSRAAGRADRGEAWHSGSGWFSAYGRSDAGGRICGAQSRRA